MKPISKMSVGEVAAYVSSHLRGLGIDVVLSGGSCVTIYSEGKYVSKDLDFIDTRFATMRAIWLFYAPGTRTFPLCLALPQPHWKA